jgi:hypothetical protein
MSEAGSETLRASGGSKLIFLRRAAVVAAAAALCLLFGLAVQSVTPRAYLADAEGAIRLVVGLEATLLALVLGFLISTCHGLFSAQLHQWQTIGRSILALDRALSEFGAKADSGRNALPQVLKRMRARFWTQRSGGHRSIDFDDLSEEDAAMRSVFASLRPADDEQRRHHRISEEMFSLIFETQLTMIRSIINPVPNLLFYSVVGWSCLLSFVYGLLSAINLFTVGIAMLGAISIASAVFLILELSDPYVGLFQMPSNGVDKLMLVLTSKRRAEIEASSSTP